MNYFFCRVTDSTIIHILAIMGQLMPGSSAFYKHNLQRHCRLRGNKLKSVKYTHSCCENQEYMKVFGVMMMDNPDTQCPMHCHTCHIKACQRRKHWQTVLSKYVNALHMKMVQHVSLVKFSLVSQGGLACKGIKNHNSQTPTALDTLLMPLSSSKLNGF